MKTIAIAADHGGYELKEKIMIHLTEHTYKVIDFGTDSEESVDYPDYSVKVTDAIQKGDADCGILICGTGVGMSIAANKQKGIRAALVGDVFTAQATRAHNDSNVLCLGARVIGDELAKLIVDTWLSTDFEGGRHAKRIAKFEQG